jgi:dihydrofolate synthase/folylpolyglutamate synthase
VRPNVILDVAHNPDGIKQLFKALDKFYPHQPMQLIFGISSNKDVLGCLTSLPKRVKKIYLVSASNGRGLPVEELYQKALEANIDPQKLVKASVEDALKTDDLIVVCGTFFIMNDVRQALGICDPQDPFDLNEKANQHKDTKAQRH